MTFSAVKLKPVSTLLCSGTVVAHRKNSLNLFVKTTWRLRRFRGACCILLVHFVLFYVTSAPFQRCWSFQCWILLFSCCVVRNTDLTWVL